MLVSQDSHGDAFGTAYLDDGVSDPPGPSRSLTFSVRKGEIVMASRGTFIVDQKLSTVTILGVAQKPRVVTLNGKEVGKWEYFPAQDKLLAQALDIDLNHRAKLEWS